MATPYISAGMLTSKPAGLAWNVVPTLTASSGEQLAQLAQCCWSATSFVDSYCRQPLRAMVNTEELTGPGRGRVMVDRDTGITTLITRRWPVSSVLAVQTSPVASFPQQWTLVTPGQFRPKTPLIITPSPAPVQGPGGGNAVSVAPGWIGSTCGPPGLPGSGSGMSQILLSYTSGWPHCGLTGSGANEGDTVLNVDDVTMWPGVGGFLYDGEFTETVQVISATATSAPPLPGIAGTCQAGAGTLTLSGPLAYGHEPGTVISALPLNVIHGAALAAAVEALETIDAIATQSLSGQMAGGTGVLAEQAELYLDDFRRVA